MYILILSMSEGGAYNIKNTKQNHQINTHQDVYSYI